MGARSHNHTRRLVTAGVAAICAGGAFAAIAQASYFNPKGLYFCSAPQQLNLFAFQFKSNHRYSGGLDVSGHLGGHIISGRYKLSGNKIIGLSGVLAQNHESLLIQQSDLALLDRQGHFTGIGCRLKGYTPPTPQPVAATIPLGSYKCYYTTQSPGGSYSSAFLNELQLYSDGTYQWNISPRYSSAWHQSGNSVVFSEGPLWGTYAHGVATYYSGGVSMPNAQAPVASGPYTLVIKDTVQEGGIPPSVEWSSTDGRAARARYRRASRTASSNDMRALSKTDNPSQEFPPTQLGSRACREIPAQARSTT